ncbi:hypothetical protein TSOC_009138 [Tetrabaena socialis]|uniref:phytol kinase n=1 Tax=Tetrabaena socialis TaxID=47790 RepID=A0A2J7ZWN5_9CHLO|nr:hypothetical protein TSOC_009138 [Tetrabaena socialis]|eukprot:PNH04683.1 hypothetical protein TSOC_009138 [Tetrabaena socialis]
MHDACCSVGMSDAPTASSLRDAVRGRCVQHLALSSALAALCAADGGPSYGLPEELLLGLPVFGDGSPPADLRQRQGVQELNFSVFNLAISGLELNPGMRPAPSLPPGRRAAVALLLRLGRLGLESGRIWGEVYGGSALGQREGCGAEGRTSTGGAPGFPGGGGGAVRGRGSAGSGYRGSGNAGSEAGIDGGGGGGSSGNEGDGGSGGGSVALPTVPAPPPSVPLPQPLRLLVSRNELAHLTTGSLDVALHLLSVVHQQQAEQHKPAAAAAAGGGALGGWQEVAAAEWWQLAVAAALHVTRWANEGELQALAELFVLGTRLGRLPLDSPLLPALPCPMTAAALAAGVLPCVERLLRRSWKAPEAAEATLAHSLTEGCFEAGLLAPLLAYGEPRQAAALVATVRKLLVSRAAPLLLLLCEGDAAHGPCAEAGYLALDLLGVAGVWMRMGVGCGAMWQAQGDLSEEQVAAPAAAGPGAGRQLALVVSRAASDWLPPLSRLFEALAPLLLGGRATKPSNFKQVGIFCLRPLLLWLPLLARCGGVEQGAAGVPATAGDWRRWLLEEMRVVPLLGTALGFLPLLLLRDERQAQKAKDAGCEIAMLLGGSCCCVAAAFPDEVRSAALSAAAAEEGVASGGSGASRGGAVGGRNSGRRAGGRSGARAGGSRSSSSNSSQAQPADLAGAAAASGPGGWRPSLLRALAAELRAHGGDDAHATVAAAVTDLAGRLEACRAGGSGGVGGEAGGDLRGLPANVPAVVERVHGLRVPPPAEGRALLRTCANPACDYLAGGSEAELPLRACGRCGAAWYCRPECQTAHWRAGHREACGRLARPHLSALATSPASQA